jgi:hypothetical protein
MKRIEQLPETLAERRGRGRRGGYDARKAFIAVTSAGVPPKR